MKENCRREELTAAKILGDGFGPCPPRLEPGGAEYFARRNFVVVSAVRRYGNVKFRASGQCFPIEGRGRKPPWVRSVMNQ